MGLQKLKPKEIQFHNPKLYQEWKYFWLTNFLSNLNRVGTKNQNETILEIIQFRPKMIGLFWSNFFITAKLWFIEFWCGRVATLVEECYENFNKLQKLNPDETPLRITKFYQEWKHFWIGQFGQKWWPIFCPIWLNREIIIKLESKRNYIPHFQILLTMEGFLKLFNCDQKKVSLFWSIFFSIPPLLDLLNFGMESSTNRA